MANDNLREGACQLHEVLPMCSGLTVADVAGLYPHPKQEWRLTIQLDRRAGRAAIADRRRVRRAHAADGERGLHSRRQGAATRRRRGQGKLDAVPLRW
jgi:hypothetical protein